MKKLTKKGLTEYLEANPNKVHKCGDVNKCVLAQYAVDELVDMDAALAKARDWGWERDVEVTVSVDGCSIAVVAQTPLNEHDGFSSFAYEDLEEVDLPKWATQVVEEFDRMEKDGRKGARGSTVLKRLREAGVL